MPGANNMRDKKSGGSKHKFISKKTKKREKADEEAKQKAKDDSGGTSKQPRAPPLGEGNLRVLLLGEGDFSFAAALAYVWAASAGDCDMVTATTLGTEASTLAIEGAELCGEKNARYGVGASAARAADWPRLVKARGSLAPHFFAERASWRASWPRSEPACLPPRCRGQHRGLQGLRRQRAVRHRRDRAAHMRRPLPAHGQGRPPAVPTPAVTPALAR